MGGTVRRHKAMGKLSFFYGHWATRAANHGRKSFPIYLDSHSIVSIDSVFSCEQNGVKINEILVGMKCPSTQIEDEVCGVSTAGW